MKVLVVDDSLFVRQFIKKRINDVYPDVEVLFGSSGKDGYDVFLEKNPDVIITDLLMPGVDGHDFIKMVRSVDKNVKIFVLTADIQKAVKDEVLNYGVSSFINKPINDDKFRVILDSIKEG